MRVEITDATRPFRRLSAQRWWLAATALTAATLVPIVTGLAGSGQSPLILALIAGLAGAAIAQPDSNVAVGIPVVALWNWTASTDASASAWALVVALCLFTFHAMVSLMATTPARATIDGISLGRWARRGALVGFATGAAWLIVYVVEQRELDGNALLTSVGFAAASVLMLGLIRPRSHTNR